MCSDQFGVKNFFVPYCQPDILFSFSEAIGPRADWLELKIELRGGMTQWNGVEDALGSTCVFWVFSSLGKCGVFFLFHRSDPSKSGFFIVRG